MQTLPHRLRNYLRSGRDNAFGYAAIAVAFILLVFALLKALQI